MNLHHALYQVVQLVVAQRKWVDRAPYDHEEEQQHLLERELITVPLTVS